MENIFDSRHLTMTILATPSMANFGGVVHGGKLMELLDQAAYACAARYSGHYCVTMSVDNLTFKNPIPIGSLIIILASINYVGNTSCEVGIKVISEDIRRKFVTHCNTCYFTMVAKDPETGKKLAIPPLELRDEEERRRFNDGKARAEAKRAARSR